MPSKKAAAEKQKKTNLRGGKAQDKELEQKWADLGKKLENADKELTQRYGEQNWFGENDELRIAAATVLVASKDSGKFIEGYQKVDEMVKDYHQVKVIKAVAYTAAPAFGNIARTGARLASTAIINYLKDQYNFLKIAELASSAMKELGTLPQENQQEKKTKTKTDDKAKEKAYNKPALRGAGPGLEPDEDPEDENKPSSKLEKVEGVEVVKKGDYPVKISDDYNNPTLRKKFDAHKEDFGMDGANYNKQNADLFRDKIREHINDPDTKPIVGTYRGTEKVVHHYNEKTKMNVMTDLEGNFRSGWELGDAQADALKKIGNVQ